MIIGFVVALAAALTLIAAGPAAAQLAVERPIVDFADPDRRRADVQISNTGDQKLYIQVTPRLVRRPGTEREERVRVENPRQLGLLASPSKMILEPGQRSLLRLSLLKRPQDRDRIFRVAVTPKVADDAAEQSGVRIVVAYNLLVIARPPGAQANLVGERIGKRLTLRNTGATNPLLISGEQCAPDGGACEQLPTKRMYAGNTWSVDLPYATETTWTVRDQDGLATRTW